MPSRKKHLALARARKKAKRNEDGSPGVSESPGTGAPDVCDVEASDDAPHASQLQASQGAEVASQLGMCVSTVHDINSSGVPAKKKKKSSPTSKQKVPAGTAKKQKNNAPPPTSFGAWFSNSAKMQGGSTPHKQPTKETGVAKIPLDPAEKNSSFMAISVAHQSIARSQILPLKPIGRPQKDTNQLKPDSIKKRKWREKRKQRELEENTKNVHKFFEKRAARNKAQNLVLGTWSLDQVSRQLEKTHRLRNDHAKKLRKYLNSNKNKGSDFTKEFHSLGMYIDEQLAFLKRWWNVLHKGNPYKLTPKDIALDLAQNHLVPVEGPSNATKINKEGQYHVRILFIPMVACIVSKLNVLM